MNGQDFIKKLSFEEKAQLLTGAESMKTRAIEEKGIPALRFADGPHGLRQARDKNCTHFPSLCNVGSCWDESIAYLMGSALADECIEHGIDVILGPGINLKRHILCGRNFEYFSEDPVLSGFLAAGYINGLQQKGIGVSLKHFAANNQECDRLTASVEVDERTLRELYLKAFEIAVKKSNPATIMCSYNKLGGIWCSENEYLLKKILKEEWGYDGVVVSDWGAVHNISRSVAAGLDLQMPANPNIVEQLKDGVEKGIVDIEHIDNAVSRILKLVEAKPRESIEYDRARQHAIAGEIAAEGMVLLKNDNNILPITADKYKKVAVIGEYASSPLIAGHGSAEVYSSDEYVDSPLEELKKRLPDIDFVYKEIFKKGELPDEMIWSTLGAKLSDVWDSSDLFLVFAGSMRSEDTENFDRRSATINPNMEYVVNNLLRTNKPMVLVLQNGGALILGGLENKVDSILEMWLGGEGAGAAVADILCGNINPSGKLSETFPKVMRTDLEYPGDGYKVEYKERFDVGYRYYDKHPEEIAYPFGHGISYTDFKYDNLEIKTNDKAVEISFDLTNIGSVAGAEVAQLYIGDPVSTVVKPIKELKQFRKVRLQAGECKRVAFTLSHGEYSYYNTMLRRFVTENGKYDVYIGSSSQDIRLKGGFMYEDENAPYSIICKGETMLG